MPKPRGCGGNRQVGGSPDAGGLAQRQLGKDQHQYQGDHCERYRHREDARDRIREGFDERAPDVVGELGDQRRASGEVTDRDGVLATG